MLHQRLTNKELVNIVLYARVRERVIDIALVLFALATAILIACWWRT